MAKNIKSLQLLRNGHLFTSYADAVAGITGTLTDDGVIKLARYYQNGTDVYSGDTNGSIKTIFGIYHEAMDGKDAGYTIYESYKELIDKIQEKIDAMGGEGGSIEQQIKAAIEALDYSGVTTGDGVVVTNVTEADGKVSATTTEVGSLKLTNYSEGSESGHVAANDSINAAIAKLQNQIDAANDAKNAAIEALDANITAENGFIIDHIEQVDGKISGTTKALPSLTEVASEGQAITSVSQTNGAVSAAYGDVAAAHVTVADASNLFSSTTVEATLAEIVDKYTAADAALKQEILGNASESGNTLGELEDRIEALDADAATYTIRKDTKSLPAEIKERYTLVETKNGTPTDKQVTIDIPKDSHIVSIEYISDSGDTHYQNLKYTYMDVNGAEQTVYVNMANLVFESEFKSGVTATDGIVHGVVDANSEKDGQATPVPFLTVGENGFKVDGIKNEITRQINLLDVTGDTAQSGKYITHINETDGKIQIGGRADIAAAPLNGYAKGSAPANSAITATDTINQALAKLEHQVDKAKAAATTKVVEGTDAGNNMTIDSTTSATDGSVTYTVNLTDVAKASAVGLNTDGSHKTTTGKYTSTASTITSEIAALDSALDTVSGKVDNAQAEIDRMESAIGLKEDGTYSANTTNNYTSAVTSVNGAIDALDDAVKANEDAIKTLSGSSLSGVSVNGHALTISNNVATQTVNGKQTEAIATGNEAIVVETDDHGNLVLGISILDAGFYDE